MNPRSHSTHCVHLTDNAARLTVNAKPHARRADDIEVDSSRESRYTWAATRVRVVTRRIALRERAACPDAIRRFSSI